MPADPSALRDVVAARSAADALLVLARDHGCHTESVSDCLRCNGEFLARWALDVIAQQEQEQKPDA